MCFSKQLVKMKFAMLLALLLLCYGVGNAHCVHDNSADLHALLDFKHGVTSDPNGVLSTWNTSKHYCRWSGVICTRTRPWRVSMLNLTGQSLAGEIATSLANLTQLNALDLSGNRLSGKLPPLDGLQLLQILYLNDNSLAGTIPDALTNCSNLVQLDLHNNQLSGVIPPKIGLLSNLEYLDLFSNNLSGIIPPSFPNLTRLSFCKLRVNQLVGSIPDGIWQLPNMEQLLLGDNSLSGNIPAAINMSAITLLGLEFNMLGKALPSNFGDGLHSLEKLDLNTNMFEGQIPASLGNCSSLQVIDLSVNHFTGQVPVSLGKLSSLNFLSLEQNQLETGKGQSWEFLHSLSNCRDLDTLSLFDNRLQGVIPDSVGNLSVSLEYLLLGKNYISGVVPATIGNLSNLIKLGLSDNNFSGSSIVGWIGNLNRLQFLSLHGSSFTGPIPSSVGNLTQLTELYLQNNEFEGQIPPSLQYLSQLSVLNLSYNNLQGNIPLEVGKLTQLIELHLSSNRLTGGIPDPLGQCHNLVIIKMDKNFLSGEIPPSFSSLMSLGLLNLSHNNLSGSIPMTLSNLPLLYKLDLSYNSLQGGIPTNGVFANATSIYLNNNWRLCGGVMDLHMPKCPTDARRIECISDLFILPILLFAFMTLGTSIYVIFLGKKTSRKPYLLLLSFGKKFPRVSYNDLAQVTGNFSESNLIGRGSYGSVYTGKLTKAKIQVAIKVFDLEIRFADRSFVSECETLRTIRHRNLLPILTACSTTDNNGNDFKALIYEFMANGNLDTWLHKKHGDVAPEFFGLAQRISICVDVADALAYLHHDCGRPIVHCDLKPTNILLDDELNAHLGDFGIASLVVDSKSIAARHSACSSLAVTGTIGYIAPEYAQTVHATTSGDVYSFGVVLLEMLIGKRPTDPMFEGELSIISFVERNFPDQVLDIIDAHVQEECKGFNTAMSTENEAYRCVLSLLQVGLACTLRLPRERMSMREIAINLHAIRKSYDAAIK